MQDTKPTQGSGQLDSFRPVEGGGETSSATGFLVVAYVVMWIAVVGFILLTYRRQRELHERVGQLERALKTGRE